MSVQPQSGSCILHSGSLSASRRINHSSVARTSDVQTLSSVRVLYVSGRLFACLGTRTAAQAPPRRRPARKPFGRRRVGFSLSHFFAPFRSCVWRLAACLRFVSCVLRMAYTYTAHEPHHPIQSTSSDFPSVQYACAVRPRVRVQHARMNILAGYLSVPSSHAPMLPSSYHISYLISSISYLNADLPRPRGPAKIRKFWKFGNLESYSIGRQSEAGGKWQKEKGKRKTAS